MGALIRYLTNNRGASAAEFALVLIPFFALVFSIIGGGLLLYTDTALQYATQSASRCWEVQTGVCPDRGSTLQYASTHYYGVVPATFKTPSAACGHDVEGDATFPLNIVIADFSIPLTATACYP